MKLLFVDSSRAGWGTEQHFVELVSALRQAGHDVKVIVRRGSGVDQLLQARDVPRISTPFRGGTDPRGLYAVVKCVRRFAPDWIVTNRAKLYWPMIIIGLSTSTKVALFRHLAYSRHWHERQLLPRLADRFYVVSRFGRDVLARAGTPFDRMVPLYNPINVERFRPLSETKRARLRAELGFGPDDMIAGFAGRFEQGKGVVTLREALALAMKQSPQLRMIWIGDGREHEATQGFVHRNGHSARHRFLGWQPEIEKFLPLLDFLVVPSQVPETFGRVAAEAQACAVPVLASAAGGLAETFLPNETGLLLQDPNNAALLATAIGHLAANPHICKSLGARGMKFVRARFAAEGIAAAFIADLSGATANPACECGLAGRTPRGLPSPATPWARAGR